MTSYFVFDMDETLAELYSVYYFIASLKLKETLEEDNKAAAQEIPAHLTKALDQVYQCFVSEILKKERSSNPLGILRPGILSIMRELYSLKRQGKVANVIIYSNNGHLQSLEFIRDLIHQNIGTDKLIKECIHWSHPMREEERTNVEGAANKTWPVLKNIMVEGNCKAPNTLAPSNVYFFDDLDHPDLQVALGENYYKVPAYTYRADFNQIAKIYKECILRSNINSVELADYILRFFATPSTKAFLKTTIKDNATALNAIIYAFNEATETTSTGAPPKPDEGIAQMIDAINRIKATTGGYKKRKRLETKEHNKRHRTHKKRVRKN